MAKPEIVKAEEWHIKPIAERMRAADKKELLAYGYTPEASMKNSLNGAVGAWTGLIDGVPVCMFGVNPTSALTPHRGVPWMMGTESLDRHAILFLKRCKPQVEMMQAHFQLLENWIAEDNTVAVSWLKWLGFTLHESKVIGGMEFIRFTKEARVDIVNNKFKEQTERVDIALRDGAEFTIEGCEDIIRVIPIEMAEPEHRFAEGLYSRTLTMPANTVYSSRVHLHENFAFIMKGSCTVVSEEGTKEYHAPCCMITKAGTKRILRIHGEDCTWVTVHALPPELGENIELIEEYFAVDTLEEYEQIVLQEKESLPCK